MTSATVPHGTTPPRRRNEQLIARVTLTLLVFFSVVAFASTFFIVSHGDARMDLARILAPIAVSIACMVALLLARKGHIRIGAAFAMLVAYGAILNYVTVTKLGLHSYSISLFAVFIVVTSLLIGARAGLFATSVAIATAIVLLVLEQAGLITDTAAIHSIPAVNVTVAHCLLFAATGCILFVFSRAFSRSMEASEANERRVRMLIEESPFGMIVHRDDRIIIANRAAIDHTGADDPQQATGQNVFELLPPEDRQRARQEITHAMQGPLPRRATGEYGLIDRKGRARIIETKTSPIELDDGEALLTVIRDVTREREATAALAVAKGHAEAANRAKSEFLANISHEIRTPLNGVLGMAELLQGSTLNDSQRRYCEVILSSGRALHELLGDILDLAKIEAGKIEIESEDFDLAQLLKDLEFAYRELALARGNRLSLNNALHELSRVRGDALRLRQILTNLLGNAIKFTENGTINLRAEVLTAPTADPRTWLRFSVRDTGIGMSPDTLARLFRPFTQADSSTTRQYGGTGLGLTIVKRLGDLLGGSIQVTSEPGAGSTFSIDLPFAETITPTTATESSSRTSTVTKVSTPTGSRRILVVEDNDINQELARTILEIAGHEVDVADNGREAVQKATQTGYHCIFMDCQMPEMDGYEATRLIRRQEAAASRPRARIVALTANAMDGVREKCLAAGMDDFVSKPFSTRALLAAVTTPPSP